MKLARWQFVFLISGKQSEIEIETMLVNLEDLEEKILNAIKNAVQDINPDIKVDTE